jgi:hypothetical protein
MKEAVEVEARKGFRIWVRFDDGTEGEVDLADLAGRGIFKAWKDRAFFSGVHVCPAGSVAWSDDVELCPDSVFLRLTGQSPEDLFPRLADRAVHA